MGRIKDLTIDLMNEYGENLVDLPEDFDMEAYLKQRAEEEKHS